MIEVNDKSKCLTCPAQAAISRPCAWLVNPVMCEVHRQALAKEAEEKTAERLEAELLWELLKKPREDFKS